MEMVNGYVFLDLTKSNVYAKALKVLGADKPVVIKDGSGAPYFVDSLTLDGTNVVITKGGKTITIANDNTITNVGEISTIMENIVDTKGNKRFVEVKGEIGEISGLTISYYNTSLSGTHLMIVLAGSVANGTTLANGDLLYEVTLPQYILDKVIPTINTLVTSNTSLLWGSDYSTQNLSTRLVKDDGKLKIAKVDNTTLTANRTFRIQFDLLIDADYSE